MTVKVEQLLDECLIWYNSLKLPIKLLSKEESFSDIGKKRGCNLRPFVKASIKTGLVRTFTRLYVVKILLLILAEFSPSVGAENERKWS